MIDIEKNLDLKQGEKILFKDNGYVLTETVLDDGISNYTVYDYFGPITDFEDLTLTEEERNDIKNTSVYNTFVDIVCDYFDDDYDDFKPSNATDINDDDFIYSPSLASNTYKYEPKVIDKEKERQLIDSLCKSDTIVFHKTDPTTVMLNNIYEGKDWDVYQGDTWSGDISEDGIHELIKRHKKIICLGHGTPHGLIGGVIGTDEVPYLKEDKKIFALWCYAATFFKNNGFSGTGILCSDNAPSEVWECKAACGANVSAEWIKENITYWSECLSRYLELSWTNPQEACKRAREDYYKSYKDCKTDDERKVVEFNTNTIQVV